MMRRKSNMFESPEKRRMKSNIKKAFIIMIVGFIGFGAFKQPQSSISEGQPGDSCTVISKVFSLEEVIGFVYFCTPVNDSEIPHTS